MLSLLILSCTSGVDPELPRDDYAAEFARATCDLYQRCGVLADYEYTSAEHCEAANVSVIEEQLADEGLCGIYRGDAALECISGIEELACEDRFTDWPEACSEVCSYGG